MPNPILLSFILVATFSIVASQSDDCDQSQYLFPIGELTKNFSLDRYFSLSTVSPVTKIIRSNGALANNIEPLYDLFNNFTRIIETRRRTNDSIACNMNIAFPYIKKSNKSMAARQFAAYLDPFKCPSRIDVDVAVQRNELTSVARARAYETLATGLEALFQATSRITVIPTTNWTKGPFRPFGFARSQRNQNCVIDSLFAYRMNDTYFLRAGITNEPPDAFVEDFKRQLIAEYVPREGNSALRGPHIKFGTNCTFEQSSTQLERRAGRLSIGHGGNANVANRFGVFNLASRANAVATDLAEDSLTASNIAILALPMIMNFVPLALIADLNTFSMLCYVVITDLFSTLPFMIKGVELIQTGNGVRKSMGVYMLGNSTLGQMEIFAADCRAKESYKVTGIVFVAVALVLMVLGVGLEVYAAKLRKKRKQRGENGLFGEPFEYVGYGPLGGEPEAEKMRTLTYQMMVEHGIGARYAQSHGSEDSMPSYPSRIINGFEALVGHDKRQRRSSGNTSRSSGSSKRE